MKGAAGRAAPPSPTTPSSQRSPTCTARGCAAAAFAHEDLDGRAPSDQVDWLFPELRGGVGENIFMIDSSQDLIASQADATGVAEDIITGWMQSPGHRANILEPDWRLLGVGVYANQRRRLRDAALTRPMAIFDLPPPARLSPGIGHRFGLLLGPDLAVLSGAQARLAGPGKRPGAPPGAGRPLGAHRDSSKLSIFTPPLRVPGRYRLFVGATRFWELRSFDGTSR